MKKKAYDVEYGRVGEERGIRDRAWPRRASTLDTGMDRLTGGL